MTGAGFVCLAATLAAVPSVPVESLGLLVGIDRLMSQCRSFTNLIGFNGVATVVISRWEGEISAEALKTNLRLVTLEKMNIKSYYVPSACLTIALTSLLLLATDHATAGGDLTGLSHFEVGQRHQRHYCFHL